MTVAQTASRPAEMTAPMPSGHFARFQKSAPSVRRHDRIGHTDMIAT
jgi:hypothetical protein